MDEDWASTQLTQATCYVLAGVGFEATEARPLKYVNGLFVDYLLRIALYAKRIAVSQRRDLAGRTDVELMMVMEQIHTGALEDEMERSADSERSPPGINLQSMVPGISNLELEDEGIIRLLGEELDGAVDKRFYIEHHYPSFPPKHTYTYTPHYPIRPNSPRGVRERAAEESHLAEVALQKIIDAFGSDVNRAEDPVWKECWNSMGFSGEMDRIVNADAPFQRATV